MRLSPLQRWMQAVVVQDGAIEAALASSVARDWLRPEALPTVLRPSATMSASERLDVYREMYPLRMRDALASDYPALAAFLGRRFMSFVSEYAKRHPSRSHTLNRFGDHVPRFLIHQRRLQPARFLADLARLELAITESFDAEEAPPLSPEDLKRVTPDRLAKSRFAFCPAVRLVALQWNAGAWLDAFREGRRRPRPRQVRDFQVVVRRRYSVFRFSVSAGAFAMLLDLQAGRPLEEAVARALKRRGAAACQPGDLSVWFEEWTREGVFAGVRPSKPLRSTR